MRVCNEEVSYKEPILKIFDLGKAVGRSMAFSKPDKLYYSNLYSTYSFC